MIHNGKNEKKNAAALPIESTSNNNNCNNSHCSNSKSNKKNKKSSINDNNSNNLIEIDTANDDDDRLSPSFSSDFTKNTVLTTPSSGGVAEDTTTSSTVAPELEQEIEDDEEVDDRDAENNNEKKNCDSPSLDVLNECSDDCSNQSNDPGFVLYFFLNKQFFFRKMFIGGLSWQTTAEGLRDYFCKFGDVNECMVMRDPVTKRARLFFLNQKKKIFKFCINNFFFILEVLALLHLLIQIALKKF